MKPILARLVRRFGLVAVLTVLGAGAGGIYGAVKTPAFQAQAYVVFTAEPGEPAAAVSFAQAYGRLVTSGPIVDAAAATLGSRSGLSTVTGATSPDAPVVEITATGTDAKRTADVANAVAKALVDHATARKAATRVSASVLAAATIPTAPSSPEPPLEAAVGAAAGLLVGGLAALAGVGRRRPTTAADMDQPARAAQVATALIPLPVPPHAAVNGAPLAIEWSARPLNAAAPLDAAAQFNAAAPLDAAAQFNAAVPLDAAAQFNAAAPVDAAAQFNGAAPLNAAASLNGSAPLNGAPPPDSVEPAKVVGRAVVIHREVR